MQADGVDWHALLRRHRIRPDKRLGQSFMVEASALQRVVAAAELSGKETVLEVGAGLGALTLHLAQSAQRVVAVEIDRKLCRVLEETVGSLENVRTICGDFLQFELSELLGDVDYLVVANIPYSITSLLLRHLLEADRKASKLILTVQREVAERITSSPGELSLLALSVQLYGIPTVKAHISAGAFYPRPKVESSVLQIKLHERPLLANRLVGPLFLLARAGFGQKRKQLRNSLSHGLRRPVPMVEEWLQMAGIGPQQRAQELSLEQWCRLAELSGLSSADDHDDLGGGNAVEDGELAV